MNGLIYSSLGIMCIVAISLSVCTGKNLSANARLAYIVQNVVAPAIPKLHACIFIRILSFLKYALSVLILEKMKS